MSSRISAAKSTRSGASRTPGAIRSFTISRVRPSPWSTAGASKMNVTGTLTLDKLIENSPAKNLFLVFDKYTEEPARITYGEFRNLAKGMAICLYNDFGVRKNDRILVRMENCPEYLIVEFACFYIGALFVPVHHLFRKEELNGIIASTNLKIIISDEDTEISCPSATVIFKKTINEYIYKIKRGSFDKYGYGNGPHFKDPAILMFSSGTTGEPKGMLFTHEACVYQGAMSRIIYQLSQEDIHLVYFPLCHASGQAYSVFPAVYSGGAIVLCPKFSASRWIEVVRRHNVTIGNLIFGLTKFVYAQPREEHDRDNKLRVCFGESLPEDEVKSFKERFGVELSEGYGLAETLARCTHNLPGQRKIGSNGLPGWGVEVEIRDDEKELSLGEVGEIVVRTAKRLKEYWMEPDLTKETIKNGWLYTGDLGYFDEGGYLHFVGRRKSIIKRSGENISPTEVEKVLKGHPRIEEAVVFGIRDEFRGEVSKAVIIVKDLAEMPVDEIKDWCVKEMAIFKVPDIIEIVDKIPQTYTGKPDRQKVIECYSKR